MRTDLIGAFRDGNWSPVWRGFASAAACALLLVPIAGCAASPTTAERSGEAAPTEQPSTQAPPADAPAPATPPRGRATLSWDTPGVRADGSCLADLAGFVVRWGKDPDHLDRTQRLPLKELDCAVTGASSPCHKVRRCTFTVEALAPATWFFVIRAYDSDGRASASSQTVSKVIDATAVPAGSQPAR